MHRGRMQTRNAAPWKLRKWRRAWPTKWLARWRGQKRPGGACPGRSTRGGDEQAHPELFRGSGDGSRAAVGENRVRKRTQEARGTLPRPALKGPERGGEGGSEGRFIVSSDLSRDCLYLMERIQVKREWW